MPTPAIIIPHPRKIKSSNHIGFNPRKIPRPKPPIIAKIGPITKQATEPAKWIVAITF